VRGGAGIRLLADMTHAHCITMHYNHMYTYMHNLNFPNDDNETNATEPSPDSDVQTLRERRPTSVNTTKVLQLMQKARENRRSWIERRSPTATEKVLKFPRFVDLENSVSTWVNILIQTTYHSIVSE